MNGQYLCAHALDLAIRIFDKHGSVEIAGLPKCGTQQFTRRTDLELLKKAEALWRAPGNLRWANFHAD